MAEPAGNPFLQVEVKPTFTTPVAVAALRDGAAINQALKPVVLQREQTTPGKQISNLGGWQSEDDFPDWSGPAGQQVLGAAMALASRLTRHRNGQAVRVPWKTTAWANVNRRGHLNDFHAHPGCYWSGTYYVEDGGAAADAARGGEFEMQDPRGTGPAMYSPSLVFDLKDGAAVGANMALVPQAGSLFLFPSWLIHGVRPYLGDGVRISIAFNFSL